MKNITINGNNVLVSNEDNLIKIAKENGIDIPSLCFLEDCGSVGQCGVCLVEIEGQDELEKAFAFGHDFAKETLQCVNGGQCNIQAQ